MYPALAECSTKACRSREILIVFHIEQFRFGPFMLGCAPKWLTGFAPFLICCLTNLIDQANRYEG